MKVIVNGKEIELETNVIPGEKDYEEIKDPIIESDNIEDTLELTEEEIEEIEKEAEHE